jgi:hypothetical protein
MQYPDNLNCKLYTVRLFGITFAIAVILQTANHINSCKRNGRNTWIIRA